MANEKRLIDANVLMDTVEGVNWYHIDKLGYLANGANSQDHTPIYKAEDIYNAIKNAPTVDAVEVVHGRWEQKEFWTDGGTWRCSECGRQIMFMKGTPITEHMYYCPECGSTMDGGNEDG